MEIINISLYLFGYELHHTTTKVQFFLQLLETIISWETANLLDVGAQNFSLLDNRLSGSVTYYEKETDDLLQSVPLSRTTGHTCHKQ